MSTTTIPTTLTAPPPLEIPSAAAGVPSLDVLRWLTAVPEQRVVIHGVDWSFYEELVDSIPESSNIHVDYDGRDLEVMAIGPEHELSKKLLSRIAEMAAEELNIRYLPAGQTTWKRPKIARGLEADECYFFLPGKLAAYEAALGRHSKDIADYPNPDLAIEVDISRPEVDRAGIYAALKVPEIWRLDGDQVIIERLTPQGTYAAVDASGFLPLRAEEVRHWVFEEDWRDMPAWAKRLREEMKKKARRLAREARRRGEGE